MSEVKVDTISERTAAGGVTIDGVLIKDGVATFQTAAGSPLVFEGATADAFETTFAITDPTADRTITFPDSSFTVPTAGGGLVFLSRTTVDSVVTDISINDAFSTTYDNYRIVFESLMPDTNGADLYWGFRATTGGTIDNMNWTILAFDTAGGHPGYNATASGSPAFGRYVTHDGGYNGSIDIYRPFLSTATDWTMYAGLTMGYNTNTSQNAINQVGGGTANSTSFLHIKIWASTGNMGDASTPGYIDLYGYKKS